MAFACANSTISKPSQWQGLEEYESSDQFLDPVRWKTYSNVCSSVVKHDPKWIQGEEPGGAQLISKGKSPKTYLLFTYLQWAAAPETSRKSGFLTDHSKTFTFSWPNVTDAPKQLLAALHSGIYPDGLPVPLRSGKLLKYVDVGEVERGPHDTPGHWLVTAAKLVADGGKIGLHVKFALLDY